MATATLALVLAGCSDAKNGGPAAQDSGDPTSPPATTPTEETGAGTRTASGATIIGTIPNYSMHPGRYALPPVGPLYEPFAVVDVPAGYGNWESFIEADKPVQPGDPLMLGLWAITRVDLNPCAQSHKVPARSVRSIADAFLQQRFTSTTGPREVNVAGYHGLYVEVTTPTGLDYGACVDNELNLWEGRPEADYWTTMPGMVSMLWILDVDGKAMVIQLAVPPSATGRQVQAMTDIVETATFETSDG